MEFPEVAASPTLRELEIDAVGSYVLPWLLATLIEQRSELALALVAHDMGNEGDRYKTAKAQGKIELISGLLGQLADLPEIRTEGEDNG